MLKRQKLDKNLKKMAKNWKKLNKTWTKIEQKLRMMNRLLDRIYMTVLMPAICWNICNRQPSIKARRTAAFWNTWMMTLAYWPRCWRFYLKVKKKKSTKQISTLCQLCLSVTSQNTLISRSESSTEDLMASNSSSTSVVSLICSKTRRASSGLSNQNIHPNSTK